MTELQTSSSHSIVVQQGQYTGDQGQGQREVIKDNREYGEYHWNEKLTLSLRDWEREVGDRQDELDHLPLTDLHVDPSPCIRAYTIITFQSQLCQEGLSLAEVFITD